MLHLLYLSSEQRARTRFYETKVAPPALSMHFFPLLGKPDLSFQSWTTVFSSVDCRGSLFALRATSCPLADRWGHHHIRGWVLTFGKKWKRGRFFYICQKWKRFPLIFNGIPLREDANSTLRRLKLLFVSFDCHPSGMLPPVREWQQDSCCRQ